MLRVRVPATTANLGAGFDVLGLSLSLHNEIEATTAASLSITVEGEGAAELPRDATNLVWQAAQRAYACVGVTPSGARLHMRNAIPLESGLGSSAAAIVAGLLLGNALVGDKLEREAVLDGERAQGILRLSGRDAGKFVGQRGFGSACQARQEQTGGQKAVPVADQTAAGHHGSWTRRLGVVSRAKAGRRGTQKAVPERVDKNTGTVRRSPRADQATRSGTGWTASSCSERSASVTGASGSMRRLA